MLVLDHDLLETVLRNIKEAARAESPGEAQQVFPVWLHVYDLGWMTKLVLNNPLGRAGGFGAFHSGIEVLGAEWSFQGSNTPEKSIDAPAEALVDSAGSEDRTGLMCHHPKVHPVHVYRESVCLGETPLRVAEIWKLLLRMEREWLSKGYHVVHRNCTDFAHEFATLLRVPEPFPDWVHGLAKGYLKHTPLATVDGSFLPRSSASSGGSFVSMCGSQSVSSLGSTVLGDRTKVIEALAHGNKSDDAEERLVAPSSARYADPTASEQSMRGPGLDLKGAKTTRIHAQWK
mmetsp:Transcript_6314/g.11472  ORF Transcript_6314/g.11472 Transcript_6314/m.11472 type:complete len:288 (-) Transcript_6314:142-1005(-)